MSKELRDQLVARLPAAAEKGIVLYPDREQPKFLNIAFYGLTYEQLAAALYDMADKIVDQKIPPVDWWARIKRE